MTSLDFFYKLQEELSTKLSGVLHYDGDVIKWEYDGLNDIHDVDDLDKYLEEIADMDTEIIQEYLTEINENEFYISEQEIDDTFIYFYIEK